MSEQLAATSEVRDRPTRMSRRLRRIAKVVLWTLVVLAGIALVASFIPVPYYALTPGTAQNVSALIVLPKDQAHHHQGGVFLTDVNIVSLRAVDYPFFWLNHDDQIVSSAELEGTSTPTQYQEQGVIDMATAQQAATVVALKTAGYFVSAAANGVAVYQPVPGSPGAAELVVGDVITAVDDTSTLSFDALQAAVTSYAPGERVVISEHYLGAKSSKRISVRLGELRGTSASASSGTCATFGAARGGVPLLQGGRTIGCIGLYFEQLYRTANLPFPINLNNEGIIGPSAGLAFTLGLLEKLDPLDLTGGHRIAATGTMSVTGEVGDVGGVAQKTVAVRNAGATLFLVPPQEYAVAKAHAGTGLKVVAVSTITQAITALEHVGGRIVGPTTS